MYLKVKVIVYILYFGEKQQIFIIICETIIIFLAASHVHVKQAHSKIQKAAQTVTFGIFLLPFTVSVNLGVVVYRKLLIYLCKEEKFRNCHARLIMVVTPLCFNAWLGETLACSAEKSR